MPAPRAKKPSAKEKQPVTDESVAALAAPLAGLAEVFSSAQHNTATHRKLLNTVHALFLRCAAVTTVSDDGESVKLSGEKAFADAWRGLAVHVLAVKKGVEQADRIIKFIAAFIGFAVEYDAKQRQGENAAAGDDDDEDDGPASRLVSQFLGFLLKGFLAKSKIARFRCVQLVALLINSLGEIDDDSYQQLKDALLERVRDKESTVRMQAVVALSKLQSADDDEPAAEDEEETSVTAVLVDVLTHDPASEVRRAALFNLIPSPASLPALIMRTRDLDAINRRAAFTHVLGEIPCRTLSAPQREEAITRGLRDREEAVVKAAKKVVVKWAEEVGGAVPFLELFDLHESQVAEKALEAVFELKPDWTDAVDFGNTFYENLTPFTAFFGRTYFNWLRTKEDSRLQDIEPVVTALAFFVQAEWTKLVLLLEGFERDERRELVHEFIVGELVGMSVNLDYGDEIGRRKMFELMREMLQHHALPPSLIPKCLDVLQKGTDERDFARIVPEIVQVLRQNSGLISSDEEAVFDEDEEDEDGNPIQRQKRIPKTPGGKPRPAPTSAEGQRRIKDLNLRCLAVVRATLERTTYSLREASMLNGLVSELIVPAVKTKDPQVRAEGLICLGLCSLLDKEMALNSFDLLARQCQVAEGELQVKLHQAVFDILVLYGIRFGEAVEEEDEEGRLVTKDRFAGGVILGLIMNCLEAEEPEVLATSVVGIAKLMLSGIVTDEEILTRLVLLYFASETADNQELRQCLSYFFPVYCYSNPTNQRRLASVALSALGLLKGVYDDLDNKANMTAPLQVGLQLLDWADPQKAISTEFAKPDEAIHFELGIEMAQRLLREEEKDERKLLCQLLPKLYIPDDADEFKLQALLNLLRAISHHRPLADAASKNTLNKFEAALTKSFADRLDALDKDELEGSAPVTEMSAYIKEMLAGAGTSDEDDEDEELELDDDSDDALVTDDEPRRPAEPQKRTPARAAKNTKKMVESSSEEEESDEEEEEDEEEGEEEDDEEEEEEAPPPPAQAKAKAKATSPPKKGRGKQRKPSSEEEEESDI